MADKKNIVIKVSYPVSGKATENVTAKMVTEWNVKRILLAVGALVLVLVSLIYSIENDTQKTDLDNATVLIDAIEKQAKPSDEVKETEIRNLDIPKQALLETNSLVEPKKVPNKTNKQTASNPVKEVIKKQSNEKVSKDRGYSKANVQRATLTYAINNKEPVAEIVKDVDISHKNPVWLYYFTELKAMKGSTIYHEWLKNGVIVSRQVLVISGNNWRTSSRKLLSDSDKGDWNVRVVDKNDRVLNEKNFRVE
jgi:hypothetical protein